MKEKIIKIRHSLAHIMASVIMEFWPKTKLAIGPAIENGFYYDMELPKDFKPEDLKKIETRIKELIKENQKFTGKKVSKITAKKLFKNQPYKLEIIKELPEKTVGTYQNGNFLDLCKGGHVKNTREIDPNSFKLTKIAGAYWRGDEKNKMLTRIYGVAFETEKELMDYLKMQEEAEKKDHRKIGQELDLFTFSELVGPGLPLWTPKGTVIREELEKFAKETEEKWGYQRITTPHIAKKILFETSGHLPYYKDDIFPGMKIDDDEYYLKAMNCPMTIAMFGQKPHSYREFPVRLSEYGTVYRYEKSGVLTGLLRTRGFTQNDAHIFCREDQVEEEFINVMKLHEYYYRDVFGIKNYYIRLSLRDKNKKEKFGGDDTIWKKAESIIRSATKKSDVPFKEELGEASFYGPKADFQIKSVIGKEETASTNQLDFIMPKRFGLSYVGKDGKNHDVVVIHRAPLGSHERFIAFLIEHYAGAFPVWLSPIQAVIIPISEKHLEYANKIKKELEKNNLRLELKNENETLGKKIREAEIQKIPYFLIVGDKEIEAQSVSVRERGKGDLGQIQLEEFIEKVNKEIKEKK